jgi:iron-sulfur cluster insertion protein
MINITEDAKEKLISIIDEEQAKAVRFGLQGGGCSGFSYFFTLEEEIQEDDFRIPLDETDTHFLVVDSMSSMYLENAEVDYKCSEMGESFVFKNPNATSTCGCGNSASFG